MYHGLRALITAGGPVLGLLAAVSIYSLAVIWERRNFFAKNAFLAGDLAREVIKLLKDGEPRKAAELCRRSKSAAGDVLLKAMEPGAARAEKREYCSKAIEWHSFALHKRLTLLATVGSTSPFIGLFGTVLGVMRAFRDLAAYSGAGPSVVAAGIAEALVNTAAGLFVAIPAIFAYNYFISRANGFVREMEWACEEIAALPPPGEEEEDFSPQPKARRVAAE